MSLRVSLTNDLFCPQIQPMFTTITVAYYLPLDLKTGLGEPSSWWVLDYLCELSLQIWSLIFVIMAINHTGRTSAWLKHRDCLLPSRDNIFLQTMEAPHEEAAQGSRKVKNSSILVFHDPSTTDFRTDNSYPEMAKPYCKMLSDKLHFYH